LARLHEQFKAETVKNEELIKELESELNKTEERTNDCHIGHTQIVSKLIDDNKEELNRQNSKFDKEKERIEEHINIKQRNECGTKMNNLERELLKIIDVMKKELDICKVVDSKKRVRDHAFNLFKSIICFQTLVPVPIEMCPSSLQQNN